MGQPKDNLTNQQFGLLTVISYLDNSQWLCNCQCGKQTIVKTNNLKSGKTKSCGCLRGSTTKGNIRNSGPREDLTNKIFGYLTPLYYIKGGKWHCKCKCGNEIDVDTRNLNSGHTQSCGCLKQIHNKQYIIDLTNQIFGATQVIEYVGSDRQGVAMWKCKCLRCNRIFITRGSSLRAGQVNSCGCVHSLNEQKITQMLLDNNIEFKTQFTFPDLLGINGGNLRFDFAIFKNGELSHLIEYNGLQHYKPAQGSWGNGFEILQKNDQLKKLYCEEHNIDLRIIKYDDKYELKDLI